MPYKDPEKKRTYYREYMRRKRAGVKPNSPPVLNPEPDIGQERGNPCFNPGRPRTIESRYPYLAYLVQDGFWFNPQTRAFIGKAK